MKVSNPGKGRSCPGCVSVPMSRRELLKTASSGFGMLSLSALLADSAYAGLAGSPSPHFAPKARNVIFCYMQGAVSHVDTFDPKPKLGELDGQKAVVEFTTGNKDARKWLKSPWEFKQHGQSGIPVSELFPHTATCVRRPCHYSFDGFRVSPPPSGEHLDAHRAQRWGLPKPGLVGELCAWEREQESARLHSSSRWSRDSWWHGELFPTASYRQRIRRCHCGDEGDPVENLVPGTASPRFSVRSWISP